MHDGLARSSAQPMGPVDEPQRQATSAFFASRGLCVLCRSLVNRTAALARVVFDRQRSSIARFGLAARQLNRKWTHEPIRIAAGHRFDLA